MKSIIHQDDNEERVQFYNDCNRYWKSQCASKTDTLFLQINHYICETIKEAVND